MKPDFGIGPPPAHCRMILTPPRPPTKPLLPSFAHQHTPLPHHPHHSNMLSRAARSAATLASRRALSTRVSVAAPRLAAGAKRTVVDRSAFVAG